MNERKRFFTGESGKLEIASRIERVNNQFDIHLINADFDLVIKKVPKSQAILFNPGMKVSLHLGVPAAENEIRGHEQPAEQDTEIISKGLSSPTPSYQAAAGPADVGPREGPTTEVPERRAGVDER